MRPSDRELIEIWQSDGIPDDRQTVEYALKLLVAAVSEVDYWQRTFDELLERSVEGDYLDKEETA